MDYRSNSKDSLANKAFALELQTFWAAMDAKESSSKDEFKRVDTPEESLARIRSLTFMKGPMYLPSEDQMKMPKNVLGIRRKARMTNCLDVETREEFLARINSTPVMRTNCLDVETREEFLARINNTPLSNDLCCDPPMDVILLPKEFQSVDSSAAKNLVGNGRKLKKKKKKNCVGISNAKKKNKVARSTKCKKKRTIKV